MRSPAAAGRVANVNGAARVEAQHRKAALSEHVEQVVDDLIVHRAPEFGVRMQDDRDRRVGAVTGLVAAFEAAFGPVEDNFWHQSFPLAGRAGEPRAEPGSPA